MKTITTLLMLLLYTFVFGQSNLTDAEYFINHDPGYGNATPFSLSGDTAFIDELIINDLALGTHDIYLRVKNDNGIWGMAQTAPFLIIEPISIPELSSIIYAEYFFENDAGFGLATEIAVSSNDTILISELIPSEGLPLGVNRLSIRVKNDNDVWGISESIEFYIRKDQTIAPPVQIVGLEYFIDEDPGPGNGIYINLTASDTIMINEWLASQTLTDGIHKLGMRVQSDSGIWGLREWMEFEYLNCEDELVSVSGDTEFCIGDSILIEGPSEYDIWYWNTHESNSEIYATESGDYYVSVYDSISHQCFLSDTLSALMFFPPDASFTFTSSFNNIVATGSDEGQNLFWQLNDEFSSTEASFSYSFISDGWQSICLEASNICGVDEVCDTVLFCADFEAPPFFYIDNDGDGYGIALDSIRACSAPEGFADNFADCDDNDEFTYPGAPEIPDDGIDQDCDGVDLVTGINEIGKNSYSFYPNPAKEKIFIEFIDEFSGYITLFDVTGKQVRSINSNHQLSVILNIDDLLPGLYFLQLTNNENQSTKPIIVQ